MIMLKNIWIKIKIIITDKNQWFIYDGNNPKDYCIQNGDWYICGFEHNISNGHKATVEEILKHFK